MGRGHRARKLLTLKGHTSGVIERGVQPGRPAPRLRQRGSDGEGVGRGHRPGDPHPQGAHERGHGAWRSARTAGASPRASDDQTVKVWDAASGQETAHPQRAHGRGHERGVQPGRPAPRLAPAGTETVKVWDAATGQETPHPQGAHAAWSIAWRSARTAAASPPPARTGR